MQDAPDTHDAPGHGRPGGVDDPAPVEQYGDQLDARTERGPCERCDAAPAEKSVQAEGTHAAVCAPCGDGYALAQQGLLSLRQAEVYAYRDLHEIPRDETADRLELAASTVDDYLATAREKVREARRDMEARRTLLDRLDPEDGDAHSALGRLVMRSGREGGYPAVKAIEKIEQRLGKHDEDEEPEVEA